MRTLIMEEGVEVFVQSCGVANTVCFLVFLSKTKQKIEITFFTSESL
jgi:hypothetical protein